MDKIRLAAPLQSDSIVDGPGLRLVVWTQGCPHHCAGCHNPESHSYEDGEEKDIAALCNEIKSLDYHTGITFSGGEPMEQAEACLKIAKFCKEMGLNIWCYTGYTFEQLTEAKDDTTMKFLGCIDVLVDGKFKQELKSLELKFKGSSNQRCIDVQKTLNQHEITLIY